MQTNLAQPDGGLKLPTGVGTISGVGDGENTENPEPAENLRHYRKNAKVPTATMQKPTANGNEIDIRLQILQQAIKDFAVVADKSSVQIAALPQKESTAIVLIGVGYCRSCGTLYNGFSAGCSKCLDSETDP